jgi:hypothetical protein
LLATTQLRSWRDLTVRHGLSEGQQSIEGCVKTLFCSTDAGDSWSKFAREFGEVHALIWAPN